MRPEARQRGGGDGLRPRPVAGSVPFPPFELVHRVCGSDALDDFESGYDERGRRIKRYIVERLPEGWTFEGKRVLDFGCGAGRVLRHFLPEAEEASEFWGSEIDERSVDWLQRNLSPPFRPVLNGERPPIPAPDGHFDLIYAMSVFTHITFEWSSWLREMHRLLAEDGLLLTTFLGEGMGTYLDEPWDERSIGMNVAGIGTDWDKGGPLAFISPWWLREHWGRAFDVLWLEPAVSEIGDPWAAQGVALLRRKPGEITREELERVDPDDPREVRALRHNIVQLGRELAREREKLSRLEKTLGGAARRDEAAAERWRGAAEWWEDRADRLEAQLEERRRTVEALRAAAERANELQARLNGARESARHWEALAGRWRRTAGRLEAGTQRLEQRASRAEARARGLQAEAARLRSKLDEVLTSRSWRLTEPLRALRRRLRGRR